MDGPAWPQSTTGRILENVLNPRTIKVPKVRSFAGEEGSIGDDLRRLTLETSAVFPEEEILLELYNSHFRYNGN